MSESEAEHTILAGILQHPGRIAEVLDLDLEFFTDRNTRSLFAYVRGYYRKRKGKIALDLPLARNQLERSGKTRALELLELIEDYEGYQEISSAEFQEALMVLQETRQRALTKEYAAEAIEAVVEGDYAAAGDAFRAGLVAVEDADLEDDRPEDLRSPAQIRKGHEELDQASEDSGQVESFDCGFREIRRRVSFRRGELTIFGGFAADGKTQVSKTMVYNSSQIDKANVLYVSLEMTKKEMRTLLVSQHAMTLDQRGIRYREILEGTAEPWEEKLYRRALDDFQIDSHEDQEEMDSQGGKLIIWAPTKKAMTMARYMDRARAVNRDLAGRLDILVGDYLGLILPTKSTGRRDQDITVMCNQSKRIARELDLWHLMLHQISRKGRSEAEGRKPYPHYLMSDLGESSGVEKAADTFMWAYTDEDMKVDRETNLGIGKARKGKTMIKGRFYMADFERAHVAERGDED